MSPHAPTPLGCDREGAIAFLGCSPTKFEELTVKKIVKRLGSGWYSYRMLGKAFEALEAEAEGNVIDIKKKLKEKANENRRKIRKQGDMSEDRSEKELLFPDLPGGRRSKG